jgi:PAS domain S-box-containing protein
MFSRHITLLTFLGLLCTGLSTSSADMRRANDQWRWVRFGGESGLPSDRIYGVCETRSGEVWARTSRGFVWFDGFRWHNTTIPGLEHGDFGQYDFIEGRTGLFVLSGGKTFHVDSVAADHVVFLRNGQPIPIRSIATIDGEYVLQGDSMLYRQMEGNLVAVPSPFGPLENIPETRVGIFDDKLFSTRHAALIKRGPRLYRYQEGQWVKVIDSPTKYLRIFLYEENEAGYGAAVIQTASAGQDIYFWEPGGTPRRFRGEEGDVVRSLTVSPNGETLILDNSGNLKLHHHGTIEPLPPFPSPMNNPTEVYYRTNGDLWVTTERGLFLCRLTSERWTIWETGEAGRQSMVPCMARARDGSFWLGTANGICIRSADGSRSYIKEINGTELGCVTTITEDREGGIWIGSGSTFRGAYRYDGRTWQLYGAAEGLTGPHDQPPNIHKIVLTRSGQLWFCGIAARGGPQEEPGAFRFVNGRFQRLNHGLLDSRVYTVVEDKKGALWFGTWDGLSRVYNGKWTYWHSQAKDSSDIELKHHQVFTLAVDSSNRLWLGQKHGGLGCIDASDTAKFYTTEDGLVSDQVWDLLVDSVGRLWIGTREGVGCYDLVRRRWMRIDIHTGLVNTLVWPVLVQDRLVYAGTDGSGVNILNLDYLTSKAHRIRFEAPLIEEDRVTMSWEANAFWGDMPADQIETRYRLVGDAWSAWSTTRRIVFNGLRSGTYRFEVEPRSASWQEESAAHTVSFRIPPPLYLRPVVAVPMLILGMLVLTLAGAVWDRKRRYDRSIRESEIRFRALYKSTPIPTITWKVNERECTLIDFNEAAVLMWGDQLPQAAGKSTDELLENLPQVAAMMEECRVSQSVVHDEVVYAESRAGRRRDLEVTCSFVIPDMILTHIHDVTNRKLAEARVRESREQLRALASRMATVREEERSQLSREIHDELGQLMTGLKMDLAWIRKRVTEYGEQISGLMMERIQQMNSLLDASIQTVRKIAGQLRPALLDELGLVAAMEWQVKEWQERTGIPCRMEILTDDPRMSKEKAIELFRIFQELLTNVARHSGASRVTVVLSRVDHEVLLEVNDNGCGFKMEEINRPISLGILGMEERAARIGGGINFSGEPGRGTTVRVNVPI